MRIAESFQFLTRLVTGCIREYQDRIILSAISVAELYAGVKGDKEAGGRAPSRKQALGAI
jgi:hypothetical protein